jgi:hypothetical protein
MRKATAATTTKYKGTPSLCNFNLHHALLKATSYTSPDRREKDSAFLALATIVKRLD